MKRILVPTDFSEHAEYALKVAAQIAKENDGEIILLHMLELPHQAGDAIGSGHQIPEIMFYKDKAISNLEELMDVDYLEGINVSEIIQFEKAFEGILGRKQKKQYRSYCNGFSRHKWFSRNVHWFQYRKSSPFF